MNMPTEIKKKPLRTILLAAVLLAAVAAAGALLANRGTREWTTDSEAALAEFRRGLEAQQKLYRADAAEHFARAAELDPEFVAAKLFLVRSLAGAENEERRKELMAQARAIADRERLTARERFLVELSANWSAGEERTAALVGAYLDDHPDDPFALSIRCDQQWMGAEFAAAERCFRRLIEIDPNWVNAQNLLGYLAMAQGEWRRAEEQFEIYRYLAPDQANPHDSLGELLLLNGRWEEARREFEAALAVKPDFCPSWKNLVKLELLNGRFDEAAQVADGMERDGRCDRDEVRLERCRIGVWRGFAGSRWQQAWDAFRSPDCEGYDREEPAVLAYHAALRAGLDDQAAALAAELEAFVGEHENDEFARAVALHLDGLRLHLAGRSDQALERFGEADRRLAYWNCEMGYLKIANQVETWHALSALGRTDEAERVLADLRAVNPDVAERWTEHAASEAVAAAAAGERPGS
jgi:Flp pilus assembly protein TadD